MKTIKVKLFAVIFSILPIIVFGQNTETRQLEHFTKVDSRGMFDVVLKKGSQEAAKIVAQNFPLDEVIMEIENGTLKIYKEKSYRPRWNARVKIYVSYKSLKGIRNSGSGDLVCKSNIEANGSKFHSSGSGNLLVEGNIKADYIEVRNSGSGNIFFAEVEANRLEMQKSGSGNFAVSSGSVDTQVLGSSGSGNMKLVGLESNNCEVRISGSGNATVTANKNLKAKISGSGNIQYRGNPRLDSKISGSGKIHSL